MVAVSRLRTLYREAPVATPSARPAANVARDVHRIYLGAQKDGLDFNLAYIPESFQATSEELFDPAYMRALFDFGYQLARNG
jgi:hypothetical protein